MTKCSGFIIKQSRMYVTFGAFYLLFMARTFAEVGDTDLNELSEQQNSVKINKCCEPNELMVDSVCRLAEQYNQSLWTPQFKTEDGKDTKVKYFRYVHGYPNCVTTQRRPIFDFRKSEDKLNLLTDGRMRHVIQHEHSPDSIKEDPISTFSLHENIPIPEEKEPLSYVHDQNRYCLDKILITNTNITALYALVCVPEVKLELVQPSSNETNIFLNA